MYWLRLRFCFHGSRHIHHCCRHLTICLVFILLLLSWVHIWDIWYICLRQFFQFLMKEKVYWLWLWMDISIMTSPYCWRNYHSSGALNVFPGSVPYENYHTRKRFVIYNGNAWGNKYTFKIGKDALENVMELKYIGLNECLATPQHKNKIGYWVSNKGIYMKWTLEKDTTKNSKWFHSTTMWQTQNTPTLLILGWMISP